ncbi:MAG: PilN domain-containing protein [Dissulfurispiraceae bacterium]|jgi:type IV pilus assembly protein PilN
MIKINLLEVTKKKRKARGPGNLVPYLVIINVSALLIAAGVTAWVKGRVTQLGDQSEANKAAIVKLTIKVKEIKSLEALNKELELRGALIETLRKNQSVPVRVLDEVSMLVPDGVWLTSLVFKESGISLEGNAFSNIDIVSFIDNLKRAADLSDVYLEESKEGEIEKVEVYKFRANFKVKV